MVCCFFVFVCVRACMRACVCVCVRTCLCACVRVCRCAYKYMDLTNIISHDIKSRKLGKPDLKSYLFKHEHTQNRISAIMSTIGFIVFIMAFMLIELVIRSTVLLASRPVA